MSNIKRDIIRKLYNTSEMFHRKELKRKNVIIIPGTELPKDKNWLIKQRMKELDKQIIDTTFAAGQ